LASKDLEIEMGPDPTRPDLSLLLIRNK